MGLLLFLIFFQSYSFKHLKFRFIYTIVTLAGERESGNTRSGRSRSRIDSEDNQNTSELEPVTKKRKINMKIDSDNDEKSSSSSTKTSIIPSPDEPYMDGIDRTEYVRLLLQSLKSLGYRESFEKLEKESKIQLQSEHVTKFCNLIMNGQWDESIETLKKLELEKTVEDVKEKKKIYYYN